MELKTLKDLWDIDSLEYAWKIKQEAIKWVKEIDRDLKEYEQYQGEVIKNKIVDRVQGLIATRQWIITFFNITEEELK